MPNIYGPHIKTVREQKGIKAAYVAARIRVSPPTYSQIESGIRGLSAERLRSIVRVLDLRLEELDRMAHPKGEGDNAIYRREAKRYAM